MKPERIKELRGITKKANENKYRNRKVSVALGSGRNWDLAFNREIGFLSNPVANFIANFDPHTALKLLDEVERQAKEIAELEEHEVDQCERAAEMLIVKDRDIAEWKRVAENNAQSMIGQKAIIDRLKKEKRNG